MKVMIAGLLCGMLPPLVQAAESEPSWQLDFEKDGSRPIPGCENLKAEVPTPSGILRLDAVKVGK